jgi:hypothetical protein
MKAVRKAGRSAIAGCAPSSKIRAAARGGLPRPATIRSARKAKPDWWPEFRATLRPGLERDTQLMPRLIAETVCGEVSRFLEVELPARYAVWLEAKAERCYAGRRRFFKLMRGRGNAPRDWLHVFMRHWLASFLHLERPDLCRCLPVAFGNGERLPPGPHPRINRVGWIPHLLPAPRGWETSRVTRHHRWTWLERVRAADFA